METPKIMKTLRISIGIARQSYSMGIRQARQMPIGNKTIRQSGTIVLGIALLMGGCTELDFSEGRTVVYAEPELSSEAATAWWALSKAATAGMALAVAP